jgi:hypothetical protein
MPCRVARARTHVLVIRYIGAAPRRVPAAACSGECRRQRTACGVLRIFNGIALPTTQIPATNDDRRVMAHRALVEERPLMQTTKINI